jgi:ribonuclease HII
MIFPTLDYEIKYWSEGLQIIAGVDEAGRGPLAGPVVAAAVIVFPENLEKIRHEKEIRLIRDSKTLSEKQREVAYNFIKNNFYFGVGLSTHETIDRANILQAAFLAMKKAISDAKYKIGKNIEIILIDGKYPIPNLSLRQRAIISGDKNVFSISAASIIAKVTRDRMMRACDKKFPVYGFAKHKGYGTKLHYEMIEKFGPSEVHRKSFRLFQKSP